MKFTNEGLKKQREDFLNSITCINVISDEEAVLTTIVSRDFSITENDNDTITITAVTTGNKVGVGNTVTGFQLVGAEDTVYYANTFEDPNTCITELDQFTFIVNIGS